MNKLSHIAFIMDGNGRWAKARGLSRTTGHYYGLKAMKEIIRSVYELEIKSVSFYAFSLENWKRPKSEVDYLIKLLTKEINNPQLKNWLIKYEVKFIWNGFENNLSKKLIFKIKELMDLTKDFTKMNLQIMFNYGSQQKIVSCVNEMINSNITINETSLMEALDPYNLGPIDLLIRTSGEHRISNFMLYELSYAEIIFNSKYWPEYNKQILLDDIEIFKNTSRRYGAI